VKPSLRVNGDRVSLSQGGLIAGDLEVLRLLNHRRSSTRCDAKSLVMPKYQARVAGDRWAGARVVLAFKEFPSSI
jgi:hypothetical protein